MSPYSRLAVSIFKSCTDIPLRISLFVLFLLPPAADMDDVPALWEETLIAMLGTCLEFFKMVGGSAACGSTAPPRRGGVGRVLIQILSFEWGTLGPPVELHFLRDAPCTTQMIAGSTWIAPFLFLEGDFLAVFA